MIHIHDGIDADVRRVRGLLHCCGVALVGLRKRLHDLKTRVADQFEPVGITQVLGHHVEDQSFFDRSRAGLRTRAGGEP